VTASAPTARTSPIAGLANALYRLAIRLLNLHTVELEAELAAATAENQRLKTNTPGGNRMTRTLPHAPYINAVEVALTEAKMVPEQADTFVEDSYDVAYLRGVITLTPETSGIPTDRFRHGLLLVWDWHTGLDEYEPDRGPAWQWGRLNEDGSSRDPEPLPVPGFVAPEMLAATVATLVHTGKPTPMSSLWHDHLRKPVETAIEAWGADEGAES